MKNRQQDERFRQSFVNYRDKDAAEIQREIEMTRHDLDETVNAIQARLSPPQMLNTFADFVRDYVREGTPRLRQTVRDNAPRVADSVGNTMRRNPIPTALMAAGLGWLIYRGARPKQEAVEHRYAGESYPVMEEEALLYPESGPYTSEELDLTTGVYPPSEGGRAPGGRKEQFKTKGRELKESAKAKASDWKESARHKASDWKASASHRASDWKESAAHKASDWKESAKHKISDMTDTTKEKAGHLADATREKSLMVAHQTKEGAIEMGHKARRQAGRTGDQVAHLYRDNPLVFGALCLGIGAAIALGLPASRKEQELMGEKSDALKAKAKEAGRETMEKVEHVASRVQQTATEEARRENLM